MDLYFTLNQWNHWRAERCKNSKQNVASLLTDYELIPFWIDGNVAKLSFLRNIL